MDKLLSHQKLYVNQLKEWTEIVVGFEMQNRYQILSDEKSLAGRIEENQTGFFPFLRRSFFQSHRPLDISVYDLEKQVLHFSRKFFFFFSDLVVCDEKGVAVGSVHRRFGIFFRHYDLCINGVPFAKIRSPFWRLWTFPIYNPKGEIKRGEITKKWQGLLKEGFTDADKFLVDFGHHGWSKEQKAVILAAAISIDFDFFENNHRRN